MEVRAFFFDQDGVIIDTERDGHRVAFNQAFKEFGLDTEWTPEVYHQLLQIAGGKERITHYLREHGFGKQIAPEEEQQFVERLHRRKTNLFIQLLESGALPLRPGVRRFMHEAKEANLKLGVCTTSSERVAHLITAKILEDVDFDFVLAGDVVKRKKPDPEIYLLALRRCGLKPEECVAVEDSRNGIEAAKAAGLRVIATSNQYTECEDLGSADILVSSLGDPDGEKGVLVRPVYRSLMASST